jgi:hypothetical protein
MDIQIRSCHVGATQEKVEYVKFVESHNHTSYSLKFLHVLKDCECASGTVLQL